jgi:DNA/RNA-binding domain of Phe-tRNA-synthetase-like protein
MATYFQYEPAIVARYPEVTGGVLLVRGLENGTTSEELATAYQAEQQATLQRLGNKPLSQVESISAWRSAFSAFGVEPTKYRCAAEALLRRLTKKGDIPSINRLVDLGNLVSIRYALPVAVLDLRQIQGTVTVHFATGAERFTPLGVAEAEHPEPGEVIFSDEARVVQARRWCWRQSEQSAAQLDTTDVLITVEAQHKGGQATIDAALKDLQELLGRYAGGSQSCDVLNAAKLAFSA